MLFKKKTVQVQACGCDSSTEDCDVVSQIRTAQAELETLQKELVKLESFDDVETESLNAVINSRWFRYLFPQDGYHLYGNRAHEEFFECISNAMEECRVDGDDILNEMRLIFNRLNVINSKRSRISELKHIIRDKKQQLGIQ